MATIRSNCHLVSRNLRRSEGFNSYQTDGFDEGETQNGVREELATERRVAGDSVQEGGEDETDTDTGTGETNGGAAHTKVLGDLDEGVGHLGGVGTAGLDANGRDLGAGRVEEGRGALHGVEGGSLAGGSYSVVSSGSHAYSAIVSSPE